MGRRYDRAFVQDLFSLKNSRLYSILTLDQRAIFWHRMSRGGILYRGHSAVYSLSSLLHYTLSQSQCSLVWRLEQVSKTSCESLSFCAQLAFDAQNAAWQKAMVSSSASHDRVDVVCDLSETAFATPFHHRPVQPTLLCPAWSGLVGQC